MTGLLFKSLHMFHVHPVFVIHRNIFFIIHFCQCLILGKIGEYSCISKAFQPMVLTIPSKDTIVALH